MKSLNNKGQTLVLFVLLLPIMLCIMVLVFDIGKFICLKQQLNHINSMVVSYGIDHYEDEDIENELTHLVLLNSDNLTNIEVNVEDNKVYVELLSSDSSIFGNIFNIEMFEVRSSYVGDVTSKNIERIK